LARSAELAAKRTRRRDLEKKARDRRRMQLNMTAPTDIALDAEAQTLAGDDFELDSGDDLEGKAGKGTLFDLRQLKDTHGTNNVLSKKKLDVIIDDPMSQDFDNSDDEEEFSDLDADNSDSEDADEDGNVDDAVRKQRLKGLEAHVDEM
jgi:hypothetical protein